MLTSMSDLRSCDGIEILLFILNISTYYKLILKHLLTQWQKLKRNCARISRCIILVKSLVYIRVLVLILVAPCTRTCKCTCACTCACDCTCEQLRCSLISFWPEGPTRDQTENPRTNNTYYRNSNNHLWASAGWKNYLGIFTLPQTKIYTFFGYNLVDLNTEFWVCCILL